LPIEAEFGSTVVLRDIPAALALPETEYIFFSSSAKQLRRDQTVEDAGECLYIRPKSAHRSIEVEFRIVNELEGQLQIEHRTTKECFLVDEVLLSPAQTKEVMTILSECESAAIIKCFGFRWISRKGIRQCYMYMQHYRMKCDYREQECHRCLLGVAKALEKLHSRGISHGGLQVFMNENGEPVIGGFEQAARCTESFDGRPGDIREFGRFALSLVLGRQILPEEVAEQCEKARSVYVPLINRCCSRDSAMVPSAAELVHDLTDRKFAKILERPMMTDYIRKLDSTRLCDQNSGESWSSTDP
jgi:hypothetical protein